MRRTRLSIVCLPGLDNFLQWVEPIGVYFDTKIFIVKTNDDIIQAIGWGDVIWCEWANESAMGVTRFLAQTKNKSKRVIVRLHSYEAFTNFPENINWDYVNEIVYVAEHVAHIINTWHNLLQINTRHKIHCVPNGVDINKIQLNKPGTGFNICSVGGISHKKNPEMMLQIFKKLADLEDNYRFHIAGAYQDSRYELYLNHMTTVLGLAEKTVYYGNVTDMDTFYKGKDFILLCSPHEGHNVSVIEAMARGICPVVHNYYGADKQYDRIKVLFDTIDDAVYIIRNNTIEPIQHREFVIGRKWTLENQVKSFVDIINGVKR